MHKVKILLKPLTPLLFRRPMPFKVGGEAYTRYPLPTPIQISGMIRTALMDLLGLQQPNQSPLLGSPSKYDFEWTLIGPYLVINNTVYYPTPLDVLCCEAAGEEGEENVLIRKADAELAQKLKPEGKEYFGIPEFLFVNEKFIECEVCRGLISLQGLMKYAEGKEIDAKDIIRPENLSNYVVKKQITGINLDRSTKTVKIGFTFTYEKIFFKENVYIGTMIVTNNKDVADSLEDLNGLVVRLGGKGGLVKIEVKDDITFFEERYINDNSKVCGKVRIVYTSPAVFESSNGGRTSTVPSQHKSELKGFGADLEWISGWDYAKNSPKPTYLGVREGSVYYYEFENTIPIRDIVFNRIFVMSSFRHVLGSNIVIEGW